MSTKTIEHCPRCEKGAFPIDTPVPIEIGYAKVPMKQWRYQCANDACGWTWANLPQRLHNSQLYDRLYRMARAGLFGG